jgi:hypothetical protein
MNNRNLNTLNNQKTNALAFTNPIYVSLDDLPQINRLTITPSKLKQQPCTPSSFSFNKRTPTTTPIVNQSVKSASKALLGSAKSKLGPAPAHPPPPPPRTPPRIQTRPHLANKPPMALRRKPSLPLYQNVGSIYTNQVLEESCASLESCCSTLSSVSSQHANDVNNSYQINSNSSSASSNATMIIRRSPIVNHHHSHQHNQLLSSTANTSSELIMSDDCLLLIEDEMNADELTPPLSAIDSSSMNRTLKAEQAVTQSLPAATQKSITSMLSPIMTSSRADLKRTAPFQQLRVHRATPLFTVQPVSTQTAAQNEINTPIVSMDRTRTRTLFHSLPTRSVKRTPPPRKPIQKDPQCFTKPPHTSNSLPRNVNLSSEAAPVRSMPTMFNNCNYFQAKLNTVSDVVLENSSANTTPDDSSILSASSVLGAQLPLPPSPFKSSPKSESKRTADAAPAKFHSILNLNKSKSGQQNVPTGTHTSTKKVSFMLDAVCIIPDSRNDESLSSFSSTGSSSSSSSISVPSHGYNEEENDDESFASYQRSLSPSKHVLCASPFAPNNQDQLDLLKERIFSKIFSNEDYFFGANNRIESASATSIQSTCSSASSSSSTSSSSSGYKSSNLSSILIHNTTTKEQDVIVEHSVTLSKVTKSSPPKPVAVGVAGTELDYFIEANKERLTRLKMKRTHLVSTIIHQTEVVGTVPTSDADETSNNDDSSNSVLFRTSNSSSGESTEDVAVAGEDSSIDTMIIKTESARLFQKIFQNSSRVKTTSC